MQLSIVIPVYDNWWLTARCLRVLDELRGHASVPFETIVVDNASTDETPRAIADFGWVRYLRHERNLNFAGACNAGAAAARSPLTLFLNNDAYPLGDALTPLVAAFERAEVAIAGGALFFEDGVTQCAGLVVLPNAHWHYFYRNLDPSLDAVNQPRDAVGVSGAAMMVRTRWFLENGGFDEAFVNGFEDVDLCMRARAQDAIVTYVPGARFLHYEAASAGRFDREAQNERLFYDRWSASMAALPRTARGEVGAIAVCDDDADPLLSAARSDLEAALRSFGHPVVHGGIVPWQRVDRRFRQAANLAWFARDRSGSGISIARNGEGPATIRTRGAVALEVDWLPCASPARVERLHLRPSPDPACTAVGVVSGLHEEPLDFTPLSGGYPIVAITPSVLLGEESAEIACVVHAGLTDDSAFGNVLLAQAGFPSVVLEAPGLHGLFSSDVTLSITRDSPDALGHAVERFVADPELRARYGTLIAADSRRRFSPRRSAIRVVDLLCAARFGLERPAVAVSNTPL